MKTRAHSERLPGSLRIWYASPSAWNLAAAVGSLGFLSGCTCISGSHFQPEHHVIVQLNIRKELSLSLVSARA